MTYSQPSLFDVAERNRLNDGRQRFLNVFPSIRERLFDNTESVFHYVLENQARDALTNRLQAERAGVRRQRQIDANEALRSQGRSIPSAYVYPQEAGYERGVGYLQQPPIPGINTEIGYSNDALEAANNKVEATNLINRTLSLIEEYPELRSFALDPQKPVKATKSSVDKGNFPTEYADLQQVYSDPEARYALGSRTLEGVDGPERREKILNLNEAEDKYSSGDPDLQARGRAEYIKLGVNPDELAAIETPAFNPNRPVIGGGGYVSFEESPLGDYIDSRAKAWNSLQDQLDEAADPVVKQVVDVFPGLRAVDSDSDLSASFREGEGGKILSETGYGFSQIEEGVGPQVNVNVQKARPNRFLADASYLQGGGRGVSKNFLRFAADTPLLIPSSVAFMAGINDYPRMQDIEVPSKLNRPMLRFVESSTFDNNPRGTFLENSPISDMGFLQRAEENPGAPSTAIQRRAQKFQSAGVEPPSTRAATYARAGFGPETNYGQQFAVIGPEGTILRAQPLPPKRNLVGGVQYSDLANVEADPAVRPGAQPRYYSTLVPGLTPDSLRMAGSRIRAVPASLLPGAADLIPSETAVRKAYNEGGGAALQQVAQEFVEGLPVSAALAPVLASPAVAPFAPAIGGGLVGSAAVEAANEIVAQETGKSLGQRLSETMGAVSGDTSLFGTDRGSFRVDSKQGRERLQREMDRIVNPPTIQASDQTVPDRSGENFLQRRLRLAQEARELDSGDFGITELLFGR